MTTATIAAILVNYNAGPELRRALQSIADECAGREWEGVVVDNASSDGSGAIAEQFAPAVRLLRNAQNVGFGRGVNQAVAATTAPLVLVMNPDCRLVPGALAALRLELAAHAGCASRARASAAATCAADSSATSPITSPLAGFVTFKSLRLPGSVAWSPLPRRRRPRPTGDGCRRRRPDAGC